MACFHVPIRPYTPIDSLNRRAAATGSPSYAVGAAHANYNGHHVVVWWNSYRRYYIAEYTWAGRVVLARGSLESCLRAAIDEYRRGALGASVSVSLRDDDTDGEVLCRKTPELTPGEAPATPDWYTWRHSAAARCARDSANPGMLTMIFDWELMQSAGSEQAYVDALNAKYTRAWR